MKERKLLCTICEIMTMISHAKVLGFLLHSKCSLCLLDQIHYILVIGSAYQEHIVIILIHNFHWLSDGLCQIRIR